MTVNQELRDEAIKEYMAERVEESSKVINDNMKKVIVILLIIFGAVFLLMAYKEVFVGRFADGMMTLGIGLALSVSLVLFASAIVWLVLRKTASNDAKMNEDQLRRIVCTIEDGKLKRKIVGAGRPMIFHLDKIKGLSKEGYVVKFEYKNRDIELLDYYEPSLYESLKEFIKEEQ